MRNTYSSKQKKEPTKISAVVLIAGKSRTLAEYGHKGLLNVDGRVLVRRQIETLRAVPGMNEIWYVVGHESQNVAPHLRDVRVVENPNFEKTGANKNIALALKACPAENLLVIYGDLLFNRATFEEIYSLPETSRMLYDTQKRIHYSKTGLILRENTVAHLSYGIEPKWGQIAYISSATMGRFRDTVFENEQKNMGGCELFNLAIEQGCDFIATSPGEANFIEVDALKHINYFLRKETA